MVEYDRHDLVCLYLDAVADATDGATAPAAVTATGIGDGLELRDTTASRVQLLDDLATLEAEGLVAATERTVRGYDSPRTVYALTDDGREHATRVRDRLRDTSVIVGTDDSERVPLAAIDRYFDAARTPLVTALARLTDDGRVPLDRHVDDRFVGRDDQLDAVASTIERSFTRESQTVVVAGPAGMGKTALVQEAVARVRDPRDDLVFASGTPPAGAAAPYAAFRQAFDALPDGTTPLEHVDDGRPNAATTTGSLDDRRRARFDAVAADLRDATLHRPVVVFLDNLHRADDATLALFAHLASTIDELVYPVAFVAAYRTPDVASGDHPLPGVLEDLETAGSYAHVELGPLGRPATRALLADVVGRQRLPEGFVDLVYDRTGGNPLFVRETAKHLLETAHVDPDSGTYPTAPSEITLPEAVADQIDRRLADLDDTSSALLRLGAVIGERIPGDVLTDACDLPPATRREYTDVLRASRIWELVDDGNATASDSSAPATPDQPEADAHDSDALDVERSASDGPDSDAVDVERTESGPSTDEGAPMRADGDGDVYQFVSGSLREAVVERLPPARERELHARVASTLAAEHGEAYVARLAHHREAAGESEAAVDAYERAGDRAAGAYAHDDAIEHYERALALADDVDRDATTRARLYADVATVARTTGAYDEAATAAADGLAIAPAPSRARVRLLDARAAIRIDQGDYEDAHDSATRARDAASEIGADDLIAQATRRLGELARYQAAYDRAREHLHESLAVAETLDDRRHEALARKALGTVLHRQGDEAAGEHFQRSLDVARDLEDRQLEADNLGNLALVAKERGEYATARDRLERCLDIFQGLGHRQSEAKCLNNLGIVAQQQAEDDAALAYLMRALGIARELDARHLEARCLNNLGNVEEALGDFDAARESHARSHAIECALGDRRGAALSRQNLGNLARKRGEYDRAHEHVAASLARSRDHDFPGLVVTCSRYLGWLGTLRGRFDRARDRFETALELAREHADVGEEARARLDLGDLARARGDYDRAREQYDRSLALVTDREDAHATTTAGARYGLAVIERERGNLSVARTHLEAVTELLSDVAQRVFEGTVALERARLALAGGDAAGASSHAQSARATFAELEATHWLARTDLVLGHVHDALAADDATTQPGVLDETTGAGFDETTGAGFDETTGAGFDETTAAAFGYWQRALVGFHDVDAPQDAIEVLDALVAAAADAGAVDCAATFRAHRRAVLDAAPEAVVDAFETSADDDAA